MEQWTNKIGMQTYETVDGVTPMFMNIWIFFCGAWRLNY